MKYEDTLNYENTEMEICKQSSDIGNCGKAVTRWFYNSASKGCEEFVWGGCEGNGNNFESKEDCENNCKLHFGNEYNY